MLRQYAFVANDLSQRISVAVLAGLSLSKLLNHTQCWDASPVATEGASLMDAAVTGVHAMQGRDSSATS